MTTINVQGYGVFEIPNENVSQVINLLRALSATKITNPPVMEQGNWNGKVLLTECNS